MKERYGNLVLFYSNKQDGNMSKKFGDNADTNRQRFIKKMGLPLNRFLFMQPDNQDKIVELKEETNEISELYYKLIEADAIVCKNPNIYLYLNFADCIPFILYDQKQNIFAFAHLGWRSTYLNLHQKLLNLFIQKYHSETRDLKVYIGPSIKKESYQLKKPIQLESDNWKNYVSFVTDDLYMVDLRGYVIDFFKNVNEIIVSDIDTYADLNYFSHYRSVQKNEIEGRFLFGVGMTK